MQSRAQAGGPGAPTSAEQAQAAVDLRAVAQSLSEAQLGELGSHLMEEIGARRQSAVSSLERRPEDVQARLTGPRVTELGADGNEILPE